MSSVEAANSDSTVTETSTLRFVLGVTRRNLPALRPPPKYTHAPSLRPSKAGTSGLSEASSRSMVYSKDGSSDMTRARYRPSGVSFMGRMMASPANSTVSSATTSGMKPGGVTVALEVGVGVGVGYEAEAGSDATGAATVAVAAAVGAVCSPAHVAKGRHVQTRNIPNRVTPYRHIRNGNGPNSCGLNAGSSPHVIK